MTECHEVERHLLELLVLERLIPDCAQQFVHCLLFDLPQLGLESLLKWWFDWLDDFCGGRDVSVLGDVEAGCLADGLFVEAGGVGVLGVVLVVHPIQIYTL